MWLEYTGDTVTSSSKTIFLGVLRLWGRECLQSNITNRLSYMAIISENIPFNTQGSFLIDLDNSSAKTNPYNC